MRSKKDTFTVGLVSGIIAATIMTILNYILIFTTPVKYRFSDFVGVMLLGSVPDQIGEILVATVYHLGLGGIFGILFAYLILLVSKEHLYIKGITFGSGIFFFLFSLGVIFDIPTLKESPLSTVLSKGGGSAFYGLALAFWLQFFDKK